MFVARPMIPGSWGFAGRCLCLVLLCAAAAGASGQKDERGPGMRIAAALDDPWPVFKVISKHGDKFVDALGTHPLGKVPVAIYKSADFAREIGVAASEREDASLSHNMLLINADAALLKGMRAQGLDLDNNSKAIAAKKRLRAMMEGLDSGDEGTLAHLNAVVVKNLPYALAEVGMNKALSAGIGKLVKWGEPAIDKSLPIGEEVRSILGNRSALASGLRYVGWRKLGARADLAKKYTDELMHRLIQAKLDELVTARLKEIFGDALDNLYKEVMEEHPSQLRRTVISRPELYAPLAVQQDFAAPPAAAAPAAAPPAVAAPVVIQTARDPVANYIYVDDSYMRRGSRSYQPSTYHAPPAPSPQPEPPRELPAYEIEFRRALMCVGAGNKPGCGCWDGSRNCSLTGR